MKTLRQFLKKRKNSGVFPTPVHFRHNYSEFYRKNKLQESVFDKLEHPWLKHNDENRHLITGESRSRHYSEVGEISQKLSGQSGENLVKYLSPAHKHILKYTEESYHINTPLHQGKKLSGEHEQTRKSLIRTIKTKPINNDLTVWSGTDFDPRNHIDENETVKSKGFTSTTHDKETAIGFGKSYTDTTDETREDEGKDPKREIHLLQFELKKGDPAHYLGEMAMHNEDETVIAPSKFKYHGTETHKMKTQNGVPYKVHIHKMTIHKGEDK